jgi:hypothetical protein
MVEQAVQEKIMKDADTGFRGEIVENARMEPKVISNIQNDRVKAPRHLLRMYVMPPVDWKAARVHWIRSPFTMLAANNGNIVILLGEHSA